MISYKEFVAKLNEERKINESFKQSDVSKACDLIDSLLTKKIPNLLPIVGFNDIVVDGKKCLSKYYLVTDPKDFSKVSMFTLNWLKSGNSSEVYSIDFYNDGDLLWDGKAKTVLSLYTLGSSVAYFLPIIINVATTKNYNITQDQAKKLGYSITSKNESLSYPYYVGAMEYTVLENLSQNVIDDTFKMVVEANIDPDLRDFRRQKRADLMQAAADKKENPSDANKAKVSRLTKEYQEIQRAIQGGATSLSELKMSIKSNLSVAQEIDDVQQKQEEELTTEREDPEQVFKKMKLYVNLVIKGIQNSVILCGAPGVGKTYNVKQQLRAAGKKDGVNLITIKGKCSPRQLYVMLYEYQDKGDILLIDDADSLVGPKAPEDVINILKGALDSTSDDEGRLVSYNVTGDIKDEDGEPIPKRFYYNGSVIVITNYNAGALDTALRGRSFVQDISFSTEDLLSIVKKIMPDIAPQKFSTQSKIKAYEYLTKLAESKADMEISIRTFTICASLYESAKDSDDISDELVESMIKEQMKLQSQRRKGKY